MRPIGDWSISITLSKYSSPDIDSNFPNVFFAPFSSFARFLYKISLIKEDFSSLSKRQKEILEVLKTLGKSSVIEFEEIAKLEARIAENDDKYLRMAAEYDNFRRRSREEKDATYGTAMADTVAELLPIIDNLAYLFAVVLTGNDDAYGGWFFCGFAL